MTPRGRWVVVNRRREKIVSIDTTSQGRYPGNGATNRCGRCRLRLPSFENFAIRERIANLFFRKWALLFVLKVRRCATRARQTALPGVRPATVASPPGPTFRGHGLYVPHVRGTAPAASVVVRSIRSFSACDDEPPSAGSPPPRLGRRPRRPVGRLAVADAKRHPLRPPTPQPAPLHPRRAGSASAGSRAEYKLAIPPYYFSLIDPDDPDDPIRLQSVPVAARSREPVGLRTGRPARRGQGLAGARADAPLPGPRAAASPRPNCSMYCRFCTRKRATLTRGGWEGDQQRRRADDRVRPRAHARSAT